MDERFTDKNLSDEKRYESIISILALAKRQEVIIKMHFDELNMGNNVNIPPIPQGIFSDDFYEKLTEKGEVYKSLVKLVSQQNALIRNQSEMITVMNDVLRGSDE